MKRLLNIICMFALASAFVPMQGEPAFAEDSAVSEIYKIDFENGEIPERFTFTTNSEKENPVYIEDVEGNNVLKFDVVDSITANLDLGSFGSEPDIGIEAESGVYELEYKMKYFKSGTERFPYFVCIAESSRHNLYMNIIREWSTMASTLTYAQNLNYPYDYDTKETYLKAKSEWYTVRILIDTVRNSAWYYYNDTYVGKQDKLDFNGISYKNGIQKLRFDFAPGDTGEAMLYLDDIIIRKYNDNFANKLTVYGDDDKVLKCAESVLKNDEITVEFSVINAKPDSDKVYVIVAAYNGDVLSGTGCKYVSTEDLVSSDSVTMTVKDINDLEIKAFLWDGEIKPISNTVSYNKVIDGVIWQEVLDFETQDTNGGFDSISESIGVVKGNNRTKGMFRFPAKSGYGAAQKNLGRMISDKVFLISFEYRASDYINKFWIRGRGNGTAAQLFYDGGTISYYPDAATWLRSDSGAVYKLNEWNKVDIYIDFEGRVVYYYFNGEMYGSTVLNKAITGISSLDFVNEGSYGNIHFDNIKLMHIDKTSSSIPKELKEDALVTVETDSSGRIFFDKENIPFTATIKGKTNARSKYVLKYSVLSNGKTVYENTKSFTLMPGATNKYSLTAQTSGYGYFTIKTELYDSQNKLVSEGRDYKFSVANIPDASLKDENMGIMITSSSELNFNDKYVDFELMNKLGFTLIRGGGYGFGSVDENGEIVENEWSNKWLETFRDNGIENINILAYGNDKITPENPPRSEAALKAFGKYAADYCEIHKRIYGHAPKYLEVWNEYWMEGNVFNPDRATPEDYANMLKAVHDAVSPKYPETEIWALSGAGLDHLEWTRRVLAAGGGNYADAFSLHPYSNWTTPESSGVIEITNQYKSLFREYNAGDKPVYASEWGWPSVGNSGYPDEKNQAAFFVRANVLNLANDLFDKVIWYGSNDVGNSNEQEQRFGLLRGAYASINYEAKPLYMTVANYQSIMIGSQFIETIIAQNGTHAYCFKLRDGRRGIVAWSENDYKTLSLNIDASSISLIDIYGNEKTKTGNQNVYTFNIGERPCYIVGDFTTATLN